jgi:ubiquinone/menaquinone biosynthesis C-methylase UbiE
MLQQRAVAFIFRVWSGFYDNPIPQRLYYRRIHRRVLEHWEPRAERVIDVGCGTGLFLDDLSRNYPALELTGVDLSPQMLEQARKRGTRAKLVESSVYSMPFPDGSFDVALNTISCHFYLEQVRAFREIARVLRPGGRFFCAVLPQPLLDRAERVELILARHRHAHVDIGVRQRDHPGVGVGIEVHRARRTRRAAAVPEHAAAGDVAPLP